MFSSRATAPPPRPQSPRNTPPRSRTRIAAALVVAAVVVLAVGWAARWRYDLLQQQATVRKLAELDLRASQSAEMLDRWIDDHTFQWSSQNSTTPESKRGREIIEHQNLGITLHLFVRETKLAGGKAAPFMYFGKARYKTHDGSSPMSVVLEIG